jgi:catechol 2,3-dioxygenase
LNTARHPHLTHMGIFVWEIDRMEAFYSQVLGLFATDRGFTPRFNANLVFMTADPMKHHQFVLAGGRPADASFSNVFQISFMVWSLESLREVRTTALEHGATEMRGVNHGNALSIYFKDPEHNIVEVYLDTPYYVQQPHGDPLDLDRPDHEIWRETEEICRKDPSFMLKTEFEAKLSKQLSER